MQLKRSDFAPTVVPKSLRMAKQDSDLKSPGLNKNTLQHITKLLDDDDECFCKDNVQKLLMSRQKSKTDYAKRPLPRHKDSLVSAIQEVDESGSNQNSQDVIRQRLASD